jgi:hypothetical protein
LTTIDERVRQIEQRYAHLVQDVLVLRLTDETLKLTLVLNDGTTLRVTERWQGAALTRYSYYWLDAGNRLKVGWDNSPHHTQVESFPHHKHVGERANPAASLEKNLEGVMAVVERTLGY